MAFVRPALLAFLAIGLPSPGFAQDFSCRNESAEIRCGAGACEIVTESFTPMSVSRSGGKLQVCAYSGCWDAPILVRRTRGPLTMLYAEPGAPAEALAVIYDAKQKVATTMWAGFANAMTCSAAD